MGSQHGMDDARTRLLDSGLEMLYVGFSPESLTLEGVAEHCGLTATGLLPEFPDHAQLLLGLLERTLGLLLRDAANFSLPLPLGSERMCRVAASYLDACLQTPQWRRLSRATRTLPVAPQLKQRHVLHLVGIIRSNGDGVFPRAGTAEERMLGNLLIEVQYAEASADKPLPESRELLFRYLRMYRADGTRSGVSGAKA